MEESRRGFADIWIGMCWNAEITVEIAYELGYLRFKNALLSQRLLRWVIWREYAASAGDPIVIKKLRTSSSGSGRFS